MKIRIPFRESEHRKSKQVSNLKLKVVELTAREEAGRGIVRINPNDMKKLGVREGDVLEIEGKRKTAAIAVRSYPADVGLNIIRMDGITRRNCGTGVGEYVKLRKADVKEARSISIAPAEKGIIIHMDPNLVKQNIYLRPMVKGDIIIPSPVVKKRGELFEDFFGFELQDFFFTPSLVKTRFLVVDTIPKGVIRVVEKTKVEIMPEKGEQIPITEEELLFLSALPYARIINVKTLPSLKDMLELKNLTEIAKLSKKYYINRYEDKKQVVYFVGNWYFRKLKKKVKIK